MMQKFHRCVMKRDGLYQLLYVDYVRLFALDVQVVVMAMIAQYSSIAHSDGTWLYDFETKPE